MLKKLLRQNWMNVANADEAAASCPEKVHFLQEDFIRKYYPVAQLPEVQMDFVIGKAAEFDRNELIRQLAWYLYLNFSKSEPGAYKGFPEFIIQLGYDSGIMYLLIGMSLIPELEARAERENFPMRYAHDAASRLGTFPVFFAQAFNGRFGIRARSLNFMLNFRDRDMYRIGRFDFILEQSVDFFPMVYSNGSSLKLLCADGWRLDSNGDRLNPNTEPQPGEWFSEFSDDGNIIRGVPVDTATGLAEKKIIELSAEEWKLAVSPDDWLLHIHIPGGGRMTPEVCRSSFDEALKFFAEKYPDRPVKAIFTVSWIANPAWLDYLPDSNLAALIRSSALYPWVHNNNAGLYFVFGREDNDYASYPRTNSLERAMMQCIEDGRPLRSTGILILPLPGKKA